MAQRYFSPAEVNELIPELEKIVRHLSILVNEIQDKEMSLKQAKAEARLRSEPVDAAMFLQEEAEVDFLRIVLQTQFERVNDLGGEVKEGFLVDFPALIDSREVLLCWRPGEQAVRFYHGHDEGFMGRKPIPAEYLEPEGEASDRGTDFPGDNRQIH